MCSAPTGRGTVVSLQVRTHPCDVVLPARRMGQLLPLKDMRDSSTGNTVPWKMVALLPGALQSDKILEPLEQELSCTLSSQPAPGKYQ